MYFQIPTDGSPMWTDAMPALTGGGGGTRKHDFGNINRRIQQSISLVQEILLRISDSLEQLYSLRPKLSGVGIPKHSVAGGN